MLILTLIFKLIWESEAILAIHFLTLTYPHSPSLSLTHFLLPLSPPWLLLIHFFVLFVIVHFCSPTTLFSSLPLPNHGPYFFSTRYLVHSSLSLTCHAPFSSLLFIPSDYSLTSFSHSISLVLTNPARHHSRAVSQHVGFSEIKTITVIFFLGWVLGG
jgi:hypothetical protein